MNKGKVSVPPRPAYAGESYLIAFLFIRLLLPCSADQVLVLAYGTLNLKDKDNMLVRPQYAFDAHRLTAFSESEVKMEKATSPITGIINAVMRELEHYVA